MDFNRIRIVRADGASYVEGYLGEDSVGSSGGVGGWTDVERPKRKTLTEWSGTPQRRKTIPIMFDGYSDGASVQRMIDLLELMGQPDPGGQPPAVRIEGAVSGTGIEWVIEDIEFGAELRDPDTSVLLRQSVTVNLVEYVVGTVFIVKHETGDTSPKNYRKHRIVKGDTLHRVAAKYAGSKKPTVVNAKASRIKSANKIRDPKTFFPKNVGKVILIP